MLFGKLQALGIIAILLFLLIPITASAKGNPQLDVKVDAGFSNQAKEMQGYPVKITVKNNGSDYQGDLVATIPRGYNGFYNKVFHLKISSGATKEINFTMPAYEQGMVSNFQQGHKINLLHIFKGKWQDGQEVKLDKTFDLMPLLGSPSQLFVGILTNSPDALNSIKLSTYNGQSPKVFELSKDSLPEDGGALEMLDVIVDSGFDLKTLSESQMNALKQWIQSGGNLIVDSNVANNDHLSSLESELPLSIKGKITQKTPMAMKDLSEEPLGGVLQLDTGVLKDNPDILYEVANVPLAVSNQVGIGHVVQVTFDLEDSTFANWKGAPAFYENIFKKTTAFDNDIGQRMGITDNFNQVAEEFKTGSNLSFGGLFIAFLAYLLSITFILYMILKRLDKREWSWVAIPALAIICSLALYIIGAKDRIGNYQAREINALFLNDTGYGTGMGSAAFLSHNGGHYQLTIHGDTKVEPKSDQNVIKPIEALNTQFPFIETRKGVTTVDYNNVAFWSPESTALTYPYHKYGSLVTNLTFDGKIIKGTVKNDTQYTIHKAAIYGGMDRYSIGTFKPGEEKQVSIITPNSTLQSPVSMSQNNGYQMGSGLQPSDVVIEAFNFLAHRNKDSGPVIAGYINRPLISFEVNGKKPKMESITAVIEPVNIPVSVEGSVRK